MQWTITHSTGRRRVHGAVGLAAIVLGLGALATACRTKDAAQLAAASYQMEPVDTAGANPFTPPAGTDQRGVTPPPNSGGQFASSTVGLFGGTESASSCDPHQLVNFLEGHPDKAAAWAGVLGIQPAEIRTYVAGLTSVVLRSDTFVTNHGFENGHATTIPAVLQAGTAVLVDKFGAPVTKCFCGNPLTAPTRVEKVTFVGTPWPSFSATSITIIQSTTIVINQFTLIEPHTGVSFDRPRGTDGGRDHHLATPPSPPPTAPSFSSGTAPSASGSPSPSGSSPSGSSPSGASPSGASPTGASPTSHGVAPPSPPTPSSPSSQGRAPQPPSTSPPPPSSPPSSPGLAPPPPPPPPSPSPSPSPSGSSPQPGTSSPGVSSASWVVGDCFVQSGTASGTVLIKNNDPAGSHTYDVTVSFGSDAEGSTSVSVSAGQTSTATVTASAPSRPDGSIDCEITRIVDESGRTPAEGPALPKPPNTHPSPTTESPTPTTESPTPTTESPTTEPVPLPT